MELENLDGKKIAIVMLTIALAVSMGFNISPDSTHFCRELEIGKKCDHLSSTEKTCYPYDFTTKGKKYCSSGWELLVKELPKEIKRAKEWSCSPPPEYKCTEIR